MLTALMIPLFRRTLRLVGRERVNAGAMLVAAVLAGAALVAGCDKVPLFAPTQSTISLNAASLVLPVNGSTDITATVLEQPGTAVQNGTQVTFTTTLGRIDPPQAQTVDGVARAKFYAGSQSGVATINATSGAANAAGTGTNAKPALQIAIGGAAAGRVVLNASPMAVPITGGTVQLTATVFDTNGNALQGAQVGFTTDTSGTLSPTVATTDMSGAATSSLTTNQATTVTATVIGASSGTSGTSAGITAQVKIALAAGVSISVASTGTPTVGQVVTFNVTPVPSTAVVPNVLVDFGDGGTVTLGALAVQTTISHVFRAAGSYTVTAASTDPSGARTSSSTSVTVLPAALSVTITAATSPFTRNTPIVFTASATGTPTPAVLSYRWDFGDGTVLTTSGNTAAHTYFSAGIYTVTVTMTTVDGNSALGQTQVRVD